MYLDYLYFFDNRTPRLGPLVEEVSSNDLEPKLKVLKKEEIAAATEDLKVWYFVTL